MYRLVIKLANKTIRFKAMAFCECSVQHYKEQLIASIFKS